MINTYSNTTSNQTDDYIITIPDTEGGLLDQLTNCLLQVKKQLKTNATLLKLVIFIDADNNKTFYQYRSTILEYYKQTDFKKTPLSIIPQSPANGKLLCIESWISNQEIEVEYKELDSTPYIVYQTRDFIKLVASDIQHKQEVSDIYSQSIEAFKKIKAILETEGMSFSSIIRQWNYIENITGYVDNDQHYQLFNDVRTSFYCQDNFITGYPAATGIGSSAGGIIIDFIALKPIQNCDICCIKSPVQKDAHLYSKNVLALSKKEGKDSATTPKFERAKALLCENRAKLYISGTAAILGQRSQFPGNAAMQTKITIDNMMQLVGFDKFSIRLKPVFFRVYIKNKADIEMVKEYFCRSLPVEKAIFVLADICRPELLIEIEGIYVSA